VFLGKNAEIADEGLGCGEAAMSMILATKMAAVVSGRAKSQRLH
jgi:hypothetical protein